MNGIVNAHWKGECLKLSQAFLSMLWTRCFFARQLILFLYFWPRHLQSPLVFVSTRPITLLKHVFYFKGVTVSISYQFHCQNVHRCATVHSWDIKHQVCLVSRRVLKLSANSSWNVKIHASTNKPHLIFGVKFICFAE